MAPVVLLLVVAAPKVVTLAEPTFAVTGVAPEQATAWRDLLAAELKRFDVTVVFEADALADALLSGSISSVEGGFVVDVRLASLDGVPMLTTRHDAQSEADVQAALKAIAEKVAVQLGAQGAPKLPAEPRPGLRKSYAWLPGGLTVAFAVTGAISLGVTAKTHGELRDGTGDYPNALALDQAITDAKVWYVVGIAALSAAAAALLVTIIVYAVGEPDVLPAMVLDRHLSTGLAWW